MPELLPPPIRSSVDAIMASIMLKESGDLISEDVDAVGSVSIATALEVLAALLDDKLKVEMSSTPSGAFILWNSAISWL